MAGFQVRTGPPVDDQLGKGVGTAVLSETLNMWSIQPPGWVAHMSTPETTWKLYRNTSFSG
jgi:hypothetical protein